MSSKVREYDFGDELEEQFKGLVLSNFHVSYLPAKVFLCGGEYNTGQLFPQSMRDRLIKYFDLNDDTPIGNCVQAEDFIDYLKDSTYSDLLQFEDDIAKLSTLIIICLESPGSLVELGLFTNNPYIANKLLVIAPQDKVENKDSFIFLGPLTNLELNSSGSVLIYPWPENDRNEYEHLDIIISDVMAKFKKIPKSKAFDQRDVAHLVMLIHDIVMISTPIKQYEIEWVLLVLGIEVNEKELNRYLYLLDKLGMVKHTTYSNVKYFYDVEGGKRRVKFGRTSNGAIKDENSMKLALRKSFVLGSDEASKKRQLVTKQIMQLKKDAK